MKLWPKKLDMRGKRVRLNYDVGTFVDIPEDADRHDRDRYVYYEWGSDYAFQNVNDAVINDSDIVEIIEPAMPDNAGAEKRGAELYGRGESEHDAPDNAELRIADCCASCAHFFAPYEYDGDIGTFCNVHGDRPKCGSVAMGEDFLSAPFDDEAYGVALDKWDSWAKGHKVEPFNVCDRYERMLDEEDET